MNFNSSRPAIAKTAIARPFLIFAMMFVAVLASGCASSTKQVDQLLSSSTSLPRSHRVEGVPFINQTAGHCGPATLTMAINWSGQNIRVEDVAPLVYTPGSHGTFQSDMVSASRRLGMFAVPIEGFAALLVEVSSGHPVIVFENLALSWLPNWHYAIVYGYDLDKEIVAMHSGPEKEKLWDIRKFERSWKLGEYWGLVVVPPGSIVRSQSELAHVTAASGLEQAGKKAEALQSYRAILHQWPTSLASLIALANEAFETRRYDRAVEYLAKATQAHPQSAPAWHNFAFAQKALGRKAEAKKAAERALVLVEADSRSAFEKSLAPILGN